MGVAMIYVGATYEDDVSTYLIVSGIFKSNIYLLPLLLVSIYIIETQNGVNFWSKYEAVSYLPYTILYYTPALVRLVPLAYLLAYLGILIWGAIKAIGGIEIIFDGPSIAYTMALVSTIAQWIGVVKLFSFVFRKN